ncbi:uncharacterized protein LOC112089169 [Eutrema salsugineum]|uniref:uncharacterized protein LOC112089169 n=1 Tax=Eutrema salsugineum TaxID=72664 RepID=UPI000CED28F2|nr:uncharacterized protein LOC112089169 [Eutrema salsugineum]
MAQCDLYDLSHSGNALSWRGVRNSHTIHSRLDRACSNSYWAELFPLAHCHYDRFEGSDHRPVISFLEPTKHKKQGIFRYDRRMRNNEEIRQLISITWNSHPGASVKSRIARCRREISKWNREHHANNKKTMDEMRGKLEEAMSKPTINDLVIHSLNQKLREAYKAEEKFWRQRSRQTWLSLGDKNTGYFHAITKGRKTINKFALIENTEGHIVYEEDQIAAVITSYYTDLFTTQQTEREEIVEKCLSPRISEEDNIRLIAAPTQLEVRNAAFSINPDKAPGPDGFSASFFQSNWNIVGPAITEEIQNFFLTGTLPRNVNHTHVRLIPKIKSPKSVSDYRPIALCNVFYKIISKILTQRLQPLLHKIISENQSAFIPGRATSDNVLITHEVLQFLKTFEAKKHCSMAVKTDMSKAYDRVEWDFLRLVQLKLGFHPKWVQWINQCVSTVSYSYLINDMAKGLVIPSRGIRQGDPLSPYLFILCGEVLSSLCNQAQEKGHLQGIRVARTSPRINHLLFADDTMFFSKTNDRCCSTLSNILQQYELVSGQKINVEKSSITFSAKTSSETKERVKAKLGISKEGGQGKYLGLPEYFGRRKKDMFTLIVDRIRQRAASWSSRFLSGAGKLTLLKSVLTAIPAYTMSCFKLPASICKRIQSALTRFWWDDKQGTKKISWTSWKKLTKPIKEGGLGLRDIQAFNDALLAKVSWRILKNPEALLSRVLLGKYCNHSSFLEVAQPSVSSHGWAGILIGRDLLLKNLGKVIGDGKLTNLWSDPWISIEEPIKLYGPVEKEKQNLKVADLFKDHTKEWDPTKVAELLPDFLNEILCRRPSLTGAEDQYTWLSTTSGAYTTKSGYNMAMMSRQDIDNSDLAEPRINWYPDLWNTNCSPHLKIFLWKCIQGAIAVGENLQARGLPTHSTCKRCDQLETTDHVFLHCEFARATWTLAPTSSPVDAESIPNFITGLKAEKSWRCLPPTGLTTSSLFPWICWALWSARNLLLFENRSFSPRETITKAVADAREWLDAQPQQPTPTSNRQIQISRVSDPNSVTCFTDAAWRSEDKSAGLGWIFVEPNRQPISEHSHTEKFVSSPLVAEALTVREALLYARSVQRQILHINSDSQTLIAAIRSGDLPAEIYGVLQDIKSISASFSLVTFNFISRSLNSVADSIAKKALAELPVLNA